MAVKPIKYEPFKRGDTPVFAYTFTNPYAGFSWSDIVCDFAITDIADPNSNTGAGVIRVGTVVTDNGDETASVSFQPTPTESKALAPETDYSVEIQLRDLSGTNVATTSTGTVKVVQDYVI